MSILSLSFHGDTTERITAWEREIATYERDSGKILDDEITVGAVSLRLPESQLKTHLLMRVDKLKKFSDFRDTDGHWGSGQGKSGKGGKGPHVPEICVSETLGRTQEGEKRASTSVHQQG